MIRAVGLLLTRKCSASCQMCSTLSGTEAPSVRISVETAAEAIDQAAQVDGLSWITVMGGEPLIYHREICQILRHARRSGLLVKLGTNAFWAENTGGARARLEELIDAGLSYLAISTSQFHMKFVPAQRVQNAVDAADELGLPHELGLVYDREVGPRALMQLFRFRRVFDVDGRDWIFCSPEEARAYLDGWSGTGVAFQPISLQGRAQEMGTHVAQWYDPWSLNVGCRIIGKLIYVDVSGDLFWCCNYHDAQGVRDAFRIGNIRADRLVDIDRSLAQDELVQTISRQGVLAIWKALGSAGSTRRIFSDLCDLCGYTFRRLDVDEARKAVGRAPVAADSLAARCEA